MKSSHCPKYEQKNLKNSALSIQGKKFQIFRSYFGQCNDFIFSFWNFLTFRIHRKVSLRSHPLKMSMKIRPFWKKVSTRSHCPRNVSILKWHVSSLLWMVFFHLSTHGCLYITKIWSHSYYIVPSPSTALANRPLFGKLKCDFKKSLWSGSLLSQR